MQKCWPMWFQITNLPQKVTCLENWPTSILTTYWAPPFYSISNKSLYKLHNFGSNWAQIAHFSKIYFLEKLTIIFVCLLCPILQQHFKKKPQRGNHQTRLHNFGLSLSNNKRESIEKVDEHCIDLLYPKMLHDLKQILREQIERLHNFCPNCPLLQKRIFLENWNV